jgi:hypothetical protein
VVDLVNYMFFSKDRKIKSGWFDAKIMGLLNTPQDAKLIGIQAPRNLLYRLDSPDFIPRRHMPLKFVAIGSGEKLKEKIASIREMIFAAHVGNYPHGSNMALHSDGEFLERGRRANRWWPVPDDETGMGRCDEARAEQQRIFPRRLRYTARTHGRWIVGAKEPRDREGNPLDSSVGNQGALQEHEV